MIKNETISKVNFYPLERLEATDLQETINTNIFNFSAIIDAFLDKGEWLSSPPRFEYSGSNLNIFLSGGLIAKAVDGTLVITRAIDVDVDGTPLSYSGTYTFASGDSGDFLVYFSSVNKNTSTTRYFIELTNYSVYSQTKDVRQYNYLTINAEAYDVSQGTDNYSIIQNISGNKIPICLVHVDNGMITDVSPVAGSPNQTLYFGRLLQNLNFTPGVIQGCDYLTSNADLTITEGYVYFQGKIVNIPQTIIQNISGEYVVCANHLGRIETINYDDTFKRGEVNFNSSRLIPLYYASGDGTTLQIKDIKYRPTIKNYPFSDYSAPFEIGYMDIADDNKVFYIAFGCQGIGWDSTNNQFTFSRSISGTATLITYHWGSGQIAGVSNAGKLFIRTKSTNGEFDGAFDEGYTFFIRDNTIYYPNIYKPNIYEGLISGATLQNSVFKGTNYNVLLQGNIGSTAIIRSGEYWESYIYSAKFGINPAGAPKGTVIRHYTGDVWAPDVGATPVASISANDGKIFGGEVDLTSLRFHSINTNIRFTLLHFHSGSFTMPANTRSGVSLGTETQRPLYAEVFLEMPPAGKNKVVYSPYISTDDDYGFIVDSTYGFDINIKYYFCLYKLDVL